MIFYNGNQTFLLIISGPAALLGRLAGTGQLATLKAIMEIQFFFLGLYETIKDPGIRNQPHFFSIQDYLETQWEKRKIFFAASSKVFEIKGCIGTYLFNQENRFFAYLLNVPLLRLILNPWLLVSTAVSLRLNRHVQMF